MQESQNLDADFQTCIGDGALYVEICFFDPLRDQIIWTKRGKRHKGTYGFVYGLIDQPVNPRVGNRREVSKTASIPALNKRGYDGIGKRSARCRMPRNNIT